MPRNLDIEALQTEIAELDALLAGLSPEEDPIGQFQLSEKRQRLQRELEQLGAERRPMASVAVIFGGGPVLGARGIDAEFAGKSLEGFLPDHRKFEFKQRSDGQVLYGSFSSDFLRRHRAQLEAAAGQEVRARFKVREIRRRNLPPKMSYSLVEILDANALGNNRE